MRILCEFPLATTMASSLRANRRSVKPRTIQLLVVQFTHMNIHLSSVILFLMYHFHMLGDQQMLLEYSPTRKSR